MLLIEAFAELPLLPTPNSTLEQMASVQERTPAASTH